MAARYVRDVEAAGSNPASPTRKIEEGTVGVPSFVSAEQSVRMLFVVETGEAPSLPETLSGSPARCVALIP